MTEKSLKNRVVNSSLWTVGGFGATQALRLISNLILTRLLFPEAFGLMALVQVFIAGVSMFSDVGINASIIQNKRNDQSFLNTAWTLQIVRGFGIWIILCIISLPVAKFYEKDILTPLLIISGLSTIINGFKSTKIVTQNRKVNIKRIVIIEIAVSMVGVLCMVAGAWLYESIWAIVAGGLVQSVLHTMSSYYFIDGENNWFEWDKEAFDEIYKYGKWLAVSSVLTFLVMQGDRLIIGKLFGAEFLGIYTIGITLTSAVYLLVQKISTSVLFPSYSELYRVKPERINSVLYKTRIIQTTFMWISGATIVVLGEKIIDFLYDDRYLFSGKIIEIVALGMLVGSVRQSYSGVLMAIGKTGQATTLLAIQAVVKISLMILGGTFFGEIGLLYAVAIVSTIVYPFDAYIYHKNSVWQPKIDIPFIILSICIFIMYMKHFQ